MSASSSEPGQLALPMRGRRPPPAVPQAREQARLARLREIVPVSWRLHADDLAVCARRLHALQLPTAAATAYDLARAARAEAQRRGEPSLVRIWCAACGKRLPTGLQQARTCSAACRVAAHRGAYCSEVAALAQSFNLDLSDCWVTTPTLISALEAELGPCLLDAASFPTHSRAARCIPPSVDAFKVRWADYAPARDSHGRGFWWLNPTYGRGPHGGLLEWHQLAADQAEDADATVVVLAPPGVGDRRRVWTLSRAQEVRDLPSRLAFLDPETLKAHRGNRDGSSLAFFTATAPPKPVAPVLWHWQT